MGRIQTKHERKALRLRLEAALESAKARLAGAMEELDYREVVIELALSEAEESTVEARKFYSDPGLTARQFKRLDRLAKAVRAAWLTQSRGAR